MQADYYQAIFKRRSFHLFRNAGSERLSSLEKDDIQEAFLAFKPIHPGIRTAVRIVPAESVNFRRGAEYCILLYSEQKENSLMNAGYLGAQLDLFLVSHNIGTLWYGIGKPDIQSFDGMEYVIMIAVRKISDETLFRKDMFKAKRKDLDGIWSGDTLGVAEVARFAPSACNSQPWFSENKDGMLTVFRCKKHGRHGIMPVGKVSYYNRIDIGIFLFYLETCLQHEAIPFEAHYEYEDGQDEAEKTRIAEYFLRGKESNRI